MVDGDDGRARLEGTLRDLEEGLAGTQEVGRAFREELEEMRASMSAASRDASALSRTMGTSLKRSFDALIFDGAKLGDVLGKLGRSVASKALSSALTPITGALGTAVSSGMKGILGSVLPFAKGGVLAGGQVRRFASGGIVSSPTTFPMRGGTGLMGEAGPEAIMPLTRGPDGKLGVRAAGGGSVNVTINITTPDVAGFRRSQGQIAAEVSRALSKGNRNL